MKLSCAYEVRPKRPTCNTAFVQSTFGIDFESGPVVVARDVEIAYEPGQVAVFVGASGSGKSSLLRSAADQAPGAVFVDEHLPGEAALIDALGPDAQAAAHLLSLCGLSEAQLLLRSPDELSDGQRYRFAVAHCLATRQGDEPRTVIADEWCAKLDRVTARIISHNVRKIADRRGVGFLLATTHEDILDELRPDWLVRCRGGDVEVERRRPFVDRSVFAASSTSPRAPRRTGRTSRGGITEGRDSPRCGGSSCSGTVRRRSASACSVTGRWPARAAMTSST